MKLAFLAVSMGLSAPFFFLQALPGTPVEKIKPTTLSPGKPSDPGWPRQAVRNGNRLVYYQPQVDEWNNLRTIKARIAFLLTPKDGKPAVGIEELSGDTATDLENRSVRITNIKTEAVRFPSLSGAEESKMANLLQSAFPAAPFTVSLDRLIASVQSSREKTKSVEVKSDPPPIFVSYQPAILLIVPGQAVLGSIKELKLQFVVNSNWDLFFVPEESRYYLLADKLWLSADSLNGPWNSAEKLPAELSKLPAGEGWEHVQKAAASHSANPANVPKVFFSDRPAELLLFAGPPAYKKISGTTLAYATNTDAWVFTDSTNDQIYYLVAGRWFRAANLNGPWAYSTGDLPEDFQKIPAGSDAAEVLASVPGTPEADDAVLLAQIPTTAVLKRSEAESKVKVAYHGDPQFVAIEGTTMSYASNADADVIRIEDEYYLCANAVWFVSSSPTGPWKVLTDVPSVIYTIPPSSPVYHVTYVHVESSTPEEVVCSYTSGYSGAYIAGVATGAALVWGTGYYYPPYVYPGPVPYYRPYYATYGVAATYFPYNGAYAVGGYAYGPYNAAGRAAWYNPATGMYGRAYTTQYPYGGRTSAWGYNPSTDTSWTTQQGHGYYAQWGSSTITRGGDTYQTGHVVTNYGSTAVAKGPNNLYAGHDGNVYKRDDNGNWSKYDNGQWQPVTPPSGNRNNLNSQGAQKNSLSSTNSPDSSSQNKRQSRSSASPGAQTPENADRSQTKNLQGGQEKRSRQESGRQSSNDLTGGLDREASARQRGSQNANLQQDSRRENRAPQRSLRQGRTRSEGRPEREGAHRRG
jgi:hypothetical protein